MSTENPQVRSTDVNETRPDEEAPIATGDNNTAEQKSDRLAQVEDSEADNVSFVLVYNKQKFNVSFGLEKNVAELKKHLSTLTGVPSGMQKLMYKGLVRDDQKLSDLKLTANARMMLVGSTLESVLSMAAPDPGEIAMAKASASRTSREPLSKQKPHCTVIEKYGKPDDALAGNRDMKSPLPPTPIYGFNKMGGKVRLTFKLEADQLWIGTKERTEKISMGSIRNVVSEAIDGHPDYHIVGIQLGPTELSRYWLYWVPAQYVDAIKDQILGKFQTF